MTSHWDDTLRDMFDTCWKMRNNLPVPASCNDEQLFQLLDEMNDKWSMYDHYIQSGYSAKIDDEIALENAHFTPWTQQLIEKCCYYENIIDDIEYEISRRSWLK